MLRSPLEGGVGSVQKLKKKYKRDQNYSAVQTKKIAKPE